MSSAADIRKAAQEWAETCISDWAHEDWSEINDVLGTEFTYDEMWEVAKLAATAKAHLP